MYASNGRVSGFQLMLMALLVLAFAGWAQSVFAASITPEGVRAWFDMSKVGLIFVVGMLVKYAPFLAWVPNALIPWLSVGIYMLTTLFGVNDAHAQVQTVTTTGTVVVGFADVLVRSFVHSIAGRQLYEGFGRSLLEGLFRWRKAA